MGVELFNCPDRSWCATQYVSTNKAATLIGNALNLLTTLNPGKENFEMSL
jgi:hypothetical protein